LPLSSLYGSLWSLLMTFFIVIGFILSRSFQWYWIIDNVIIKASVCPKISLFFSYFSLSHLSSQIMRDRRKKKDFRSTSKLWWRYHLYHQKDLDEMNSMTLRKVNNNDCNGSHEPPKIKWTRTPLDNSCDSLR